MRILQKSRLLISKWPIVEMKRNILIHLQFDFSPIYDRIYVYCVVHLTRANVFSAVMYARNMHFDRVSNSLFRVWQVLP